MKTWHCLNCAHSQLQGNFRVYTPDNKIRQIRPSYTPSADDFSAIKYLCENHGFTYGE